MEKCCRVSMVSDKTPLDPKLDQLFRHAAAHHKANMCFNCGASAANQSVCLSPWF